MSKDKGPIPLHVKILSGCLLTSMAFAGIVGYQLYTNKDHLVSSTVYMSALEESIRQSTEDTPLATPLNRLLENNYGRPNVFGDYLIGRFAQIHHDWSQASDVMQKVLKENPENLELLKRGMILAMGSGDAETALKTAHQIYKQEKDSALVILFLIAEAFKSEDYDAATAYVNALPKGSVSDFILPLLQSWTDAAKGALNISKLKNNSIHMYHAVLISDFLEQKGEIQSLLINAEKANDLSLYDLERIADLYAHIGEQDKALNFYRQITKLRPQPLVQKKIEDLESGAFRSSFESIRSPQEGISGAFYDMARALIDEYSDESARVFGNIALYLDPDFTNAKLLLAHITARNERFSEAIGYYKSVNPDDRGYLDARRKVADLLEEIGQYDNAVSELEALIETYNDTDSMIQIGDLYRHKDEFEIAVKHYNRAIENLGSKVPEDYWHLHYVRGMAYERLGIWDKAEVDLKAALAFKPNQPYVLNYLGYAWADQGIHLDESLEMIRKAVALRPADGYITDSLGWVLYRMGDYQEAVVHLERAVELLPYDTTVNDHLGDAYWQIGRKTEARFQWERAINYSDGDDEEMIEKIKDKLERGLPDMAKNSQTNDQKG